MSQYQSAEARYIQDTLVFCNEDEIAEQIRNLPNDLRYDPALLMQMRLTNAKQHRDEYDRECALRLQAELNIARDQPAHEFKQPVPGYVPTSRPAMPTPMLTIPAPKPAVRPVSQAPPMRQERKEREKKDPTLYRQEPERQIEGYQTPPPPLRNEVPPAPRKQVGWADRAQDQQVSAARHLDFTKPANPAGDAAWDRFLAQRHRKQSDAFRARARN